MLNLIKLFIFGVSLSLTNVAFACESDKDCGSGCHCNDVGHTWACVCDKEKESHN